ncbi:hypothetical protein HDU83_007923 [Entophlyctis luteolus]|nr:hypothetical protein HDU83_007923 [Entophlyctis luteolus]
MRPSKMDVVRATLAEYSSEQHDKDKERKEAFERQLLNKLIGQRHHLIGTKSIPGVMAKIKDSRLGSIDPIAYLRENKLLQEDKTLSLPPLTIFTEAQLRQSDDTKRWIAANIGRKASKRRDHEKALKSSKLVQGPFLVNSNVVCFQ